MLYGKDYETNFPTVNDIWFCGIIQISNEKMVSKNRSTPFQFTCVTHLHKHIEKSFVTFLFSAFVSTSSNVKSYNFWPKVVTDKKKKARRRDA